MRKTLLNALKHGSGILLTLFSLLCSCHVWATGANIQVYADETIVLDVHGHSYANTAGANFVIKVGGTEVGSATHNSTGIYEITISANVSGEMKVERLNPSGGVWNTFTVTESRTTGANRLQITGEHDGESANYNWKFVRYFEEDEYIYFVNGTGYPFKCNNSTCDGGTVDACWILSNSYAGIKLTMVDGTTQYAWFTYVSGVAGTAGAVYRAQITTAGYCKSFIITRNASSGGDPTDSFWNRTGDLGYNNTNKGYNTITGTAREGTDWSGNHTVYCNDPTVTTTSAPSVKSTTTATCTGSYTSETGECTPTGGGIAYRTAGGSYSYQSGSASAGAISASLSSLTAKTTYYYKAYVEIGGTKVYGGEHSFTTDCISGVATTNPSTATQSECLGSATALSVTASSGPGSGYTYQWYYNSSEDKSGATPIPGATSASYTPAVVGENYYYCSVGAAGGYCDVDSNFSGKITIKGVPVVSASASSVTNYVPVTLTATGADVNTWSVVVSSGTSSNHYLYSKTASSAKFKGTVDDESDATYTITATTADSCSSTATVTVSANADNCQ